MNKFGDFTRRRFQKNNIADRLARNEDRTDDALRKRVSIKALNDLTSAVGEATFTEMTSDTYGLINWFKTIGIPQDEAMSIHAIVYNPVDGCIYLGGMFVTLGGVAAANIAKYDPTTKTISALSTGLNSTVYALAVDSTGLLYVGGAFTNAGGDANADKFCQWDGAAFSACGAAFAGLASNVQALAVDPTNDDVYIGGGFVNIGDANGDYIVKWDGSAISSLSTGLNGTVYALAVDSTGLLYVGGAFTNGGGDANADTFCKWNGSAFSACGTAFAGAAANYPRAILIDDNDDVYIGGTFINIGDANGDYIVKWDGSAYSSLSTGLAYSAYCLAKDINGTIYAGTANLSGSGMSLIYAWDGETLSTLGSGVDAGLTSMCFDADMLYFGGAFREAGDGRTMWGFASYGPAALEEILEYLLVRAGKSQVLGCVPNATVPASTTIYTAPFTDSLSGTSVNVALVVPRSGVVKNLYVRTSGAQPATGILYVTVYEGAAATGLTVAIPAGAAGGVYSDLTNSFYVQAGIRISFEVNNQATSASANITSIAVEFY